MKIRINAQAKYTALTDPLGTPIASSPFWCNNKCKFSTPETQKNGARIKKLHGAKVCQVRRRSAAHQHIRGASEFRTILRRRLRFYLHSHDYRLKSKIWLRNVSIGSSSWRAWIPHYRTSTAKNTSDFLSARCDTFQPVTSASTARGLG